MNNDRYEVECKDGRHIKALFDIPLGTFSTFFNLLAGGKKFSEFVAD